MPHLEPETKANYVDERRQNGAITAAKNLQTKGADLANRGILGVSDQPNTARICEPHFTHKFP
jgi:hypothetical protein